MGGTWVGFIINDDCGRVGSLRGAKKRFATQKRKANPPGKG